MGLPELGRLHALTAMEACLGAADPRVMVRKAVAKDRAGLKVGGHVFDLDPVRRVMVIGGGKASALMASALEDILGERITAGRVVVPESQVAFPGLQRIRLLKSTHPLPTQEGVNAVNTMLSLTDDVTEDDLVICLISGGGSALMPLPIEGVSIADKRFVTELLLRSGANIKEVNCVRKHLSALKGGRLAERLFPANVVALIVSDVVGDGLASVASGPTMPDESTFADAKAILTNSGVWEGTPTSVRRAMEKGMAGEIPETPKPGAEAFERVANVSIGSNEMATHAAADALRRLGYRVTTIGSVEGEARDFGARLARLARNKESRTAIVAGGETTVHVRGDGKGGRNQEIALAAALELAGKGVTLISFSTDGIDGPTDAAGAIADSSTISRGAKLRMVAEKYLNNNDSYTFFRALNDLVITGPTGSNINDVSIAIVRSWPTSSPKA